MQPAIAEASRSHHGQLENIPMPILMLLKAINLFHPRVICKQWTTSLMTQTIVNNLMCNSPVKKILGEGEVTTEVTLIDPGNRKGPVHRSVAGTGHSVWKDSIRGHYLKTTLHLENI